MNKISPELWLSAVIALGLFYGGIRGLKKSMKVKKLTRFDLNDRGGATSALIMATFLATIFFIPKQYSLTATLIYVALLIINAAYWITRKILLARMERRKKLQDQAITNGAQQGVPPYVAQGAPSGER